MLLFRSEEHVDKWCRDWRFVRGAVLSLPQCWQLARAWYRDDRRDPRWHRRTVDEAQFENRLREWDFDMITAAWGESLSPGNEQRGFWGSQAADQPGSLNYVGIKNPAVDAMIEQVVFAKSYDDLVAAAKALDRILLWNHYVVPQWSYNKLRAARWDRFDPRLRCRNTAGQHSPLFGGWIRPKPRRSQRTLDAAEIRGHERNIPAL